MERIRTTRKRETTIRGTSRGTNNKEIIKRKRDRTSNIINDNNTIGTLRSSNNNIRKKQKRTINLPYKSNSRSKMSNSSMPSIRSISSSRSNIDFDISELNINEMANMLKEYYIDTNNDAHFDRIFNILQKKTEIIRKFDLSFTTFNKKLIYPATLINIMSRISNLKIFNIAKKKNYADLYESYGSITRINYLLTILDTIGMKVLYIINNDNKLYYSPLNYRKIRNVIRKDEKYIYKNFLDNQKKIIDASEYDIIFMSAGYHDFLNGNKNLVELTNFDTKKHYRSSILNNNFNYSINKTGRHDISISKCNNYNIVNTTWKPFNIYNIDNFIPGTNKYYYINKNNLIEINSKDIIEKKLEYYTSGYIPYMDIKDSFNNIHLFSNRRTLKTKVYKNMTAGNSRSIDYINMIPEISLCYNIFFPSNEYGFCWFSSIINALFYADDISSIFLNKSIRNMDKTLNYIENLYNEDYNSFDETDIKTLKIFFGHLINLFTFIYCSFNILSKNQLNDKITNKRKWLEIYNKIIDKYDIIYVFIIVLSKTKN